jgi:hypothetical protein
MLFPPNVIETISDCVAWADRLTRADLQAGIIVTENDYTSNFTSALRREIAGRNVPGLTARIQVLNPTAERGNGADGCIILSNCQEFKVGLFEAKWPRLSTKVNSWDSTQKSTGKSHFDDQISRQQFAASQGVAIWEMFYLEHAFGEQPESFPEQGSACVWHEQAMNASRARNQVSPWTDQELEKLVRTSGIDTASVVRQICECSKGKPFPEQEYARALSNYVLPEKALIVSHSKSKRAKA